MIGALKRLLGDLTRDSQPVRFADEDYRLAAAALLFHVIAIDGTVSEDERAKLSGLLKQRFGLDDEAVGELVAAAENADNEAVDLYGFTSVLKRRLDEAERERIIEMMWTLVFADGKVHEFEDNLLWRVAELLGVSSQTRIRLKQAVRGNAGA